MVCASFLCRYLSSHHRLRSLSTLQYGQYSLYRFSSFAECGLHDPRRKSGHRCNETLHGERGGVEHFDIHEHDILKTRVNEDEVAEHTLIHTRFFLGLFLLRLILRLAIRLAIRLALRLALRLRVNILHVHIILTYMSVFLYRIFDHLGQNKRSSQTTLVYTCQRFLVFFRNSVPDRVVYKLL